METHERRKSEAKRTAVLFALPLLVLGAVPTSQFYKQQVQQRRTRALVAHVEKSWCGVTEGPGALPISVAMERCRHAEIAWLADNGADVNARLPNGKSLVYWLTLRHQYDSAWHIQNAGAVPDTRTDIFLKMGHTSRLNTTLFQAILRSDLQSVKKAVARGAQVDSFVDVDGTRRWPLTKAIAVGDPQIVAHILSEGADARARPNGVSLLLSAILDDAVPDLSTLRGLKAAGAPTSPEIEMFIAVIANEPGRVAKYLRAGIADEVPTCSGKIWIWSPKRHALQWAVAHASPNMVRLLVRHGAKLPNATG